MSRNISITATLEGENKSGGAFSEMTADIKALDQDLDRLEREIRVGLKLDDDASDDLKAANEKLDDWDGRDATATIKLKDQATGNLRYAFSYLDSWGESDATATIRLDDKATKDVRLAFAYLDTWDEFEATATLKVSDRASTDIKKAAGELESFDGEDATATLQADNRASAEIKGASAELGRFDGEDATATLDARDSATPKIAKATAGATAFGRLNPTVTVDADTAGASGGFAKTTAEATAVGRLNPTVDVDVDTAGATTQLLAFSGTAVGTTAATQGLTTSMLGLTSPLVLGALVPLVVGATAAVGPLAAGLAVAGTAGIAAAAGFGLLAGAIAAPIAEIVKFKEAQKGQEAATNAAASATKSYEAAQDSLADAQRGVTAAERSVADARRSAAQGVTAAEQDYRDSLQGVADAQRAVKEAESGIHEAVRTAAQGVTTAEADYEDALRGVAEAQREVKAAERGVHEAQRAAAEGVANAEAAHEEALRGVAEAQREVKAAERGIHQAQRAAAEGVANAETDYEEALRGVAEAQRGVVEAERGVTSARRAAADATADATDAVADAREELEDSTRSLAAAQRDLNIAERAEPLNQAEATLDLADARDRASDAQRDYNKAVAEYGKNSEDATDAARDLQRAELELQRTEQETRLSRKKGSDELRSAQEGVETAYDSQKDAAEGVAGAEKDLSSARREGAKEVRDAQRAVSEAQRGVAAAQREALAAEREILRARREGARGIAEAQRQVSEAQRAVVDAQREALQAEKEISRARAEGARQVKEAQRAVADAQRGVLDAQREALAAEKEIQRARQEGARGIREAQRSASEAQRALADSQRDAAKAEQEIARARKEGARQVKEAQRGVADAQRAAARASDEVADAAQAMAKAQKEAANDGGELSRSAEKLYDSFKELGPAYRAAFKGSKGEAAELGDEILDVAKDALPALGREVEETVRGARKAFSGLRKDLGGREKDSLNTILDSSSDIVEDLLRAGGRTFGGLSNVIADIVPYAKDFSQYLSDVSDDFLKWSRTEKARDQIEKWVKTAKPLFKELADSTGDFLGFLISFGNKHSDELVDALDLVGATLDALFGGKEQKERQKDAGKAGAMTGSAYSDKFVESQNKAAKDEGDDIGMRWGTAIGKGIGNLSQWILNADKRNNSGEPMGLGFAKGFLRGWRDAFDDYDFSKSELADLLDFGDFKDSELYDLIQDAEKRLNQFGNFLEKLGPKIKDWLVSPFENAYDAIVGNSIVPDLADDVTDVFGKLPDRIGDALKSLPGKVGGIFRDAFEQGSGYLQDLAKSADEKTGDAQKSIVEHLTGGKTKGLEQIGLLRKDGTLDFEGLRKAADEKMDSARKWVGDHLTAAKTKGLEQIGVLRKDGSIDFEGLRKTATDKTKVAKENVASALWDAAQMGVKALGELRDKGGEAMSQARDRWTDPVRASSIDQQGFMNNMLYGMGQVIEKAGLDLKKPEQFKVNEGTSDPTGRGAGMNERFGMAAGGIVGGGGVLQLAGGGNIWAQGGDLRGPRQSRLVEVGEGEHDEAVIAITKNPTLRPNQEHYMRVGADLIGGAFLSAAELQASEIRSYASGGVFDRVKGDLKRYAPHLAFADAPDGTPVPIPKNRQGRGRTEPGSLEERYFGREWATYGGTGGGGGWPPNNGWSVGGGSGPLGYTASGAAAQLAAAGANAYPKGWITQGGSDVAVSMADLGGALRGLSYTSGKMLLDVAAQVTASKHEWAHMFNLGHGGTGIVGGGGEINDADLAAISSYRNLPLGGGDPNGKDSGEKDAAGRSERLAEAGRGGSNITQSQTGPGSQRQSSSGANAGREFDRIWGLTTGNMPGWMSGIFGMAEGGVLASERSADKVPWEANGIPGVPVWRRDEDPNAAARREEILKRPPLGNMKGLVPRGAKVGSGEGLGATMQTYIPEMDAYRKGVMSAFPDVYTNTYSNHPMDFEQPYYRERSIDHWGQGYRGDPIPTDTGDKVAAYAIDKLQGDLNWLIWNGKMLDAGGWGPDTSGFSHAGPQAHVHVTAFANRSTVSGDAGTGGLGGSSGIDIQPLIDQHIKQVPDWGKGLPRDSAEGIAKAAREAIVKRLEAEAAKMSGGSTGGEYSGGGNLDQWITDGFKFGNAFDDTPDNHAKMKARALQESGGDPMAVNNWDINAQNGTPSKGVVQVIKPEWELRQTQYGEDAGPFEPNWKNPVKSVGIGSRRMKAAYGEVLGDTGEGYKGGGLIRKDHTARVHKDELYLPIGEDPRAATEFMGFLKNLAPKGFDSADMRSEYERRIADAEGRGPAASFEGTGRGSDPRQRSYDPRAAAQRDETNRRLRAVEDGLSEQTERFEAAAALIERATRGVGPDVGDRIVHGAGGPSDLTSAIRDGQEAEEEYAGTGGKRYGRRR